MLFPTGLVELSPLNEYFSTLGQVLLVSMNVVLACILAQCKFSIL